MSPQRRCNLRNLILSEDSKSVSRPELHACGLISFCLENLNLRIERRIDLFNNLLPEGFIWFDTFNPDLEVKWLKPTECFWVLIPWIEEAHELSSCGMPPHSFSLVIDGSTREISEIWKLIKYAAATQEARLEQCRLLKEDPSPRSHRLDYYLCSALPTNFAKMIREIVEGSSVVRFEGDVGELWDPDVFFFERRDWSDEQ